MFEKLRHGFQLPGVSPAEIEECETKLRIMFPDDYKAFLLTSNGFNDEIGEGYLVLWNIEELSSADGYELFELRPNRFLIGSNGGPTAYGIIDGSYISPPFVFAGHHRPYLDTMTASRLADLESSWHFQESIRFRQLSSDGKRAIFRRIRWRSCA